MKVLVYLVLHHVWAIQWALSQSYTDFDNIDLDSKWYMMCPKMYPRVFQGYGPRGNVSAGIYEKQEKIHSLSDCLESCCEMEKCNVIFMVESTCYHIECDTLTKCLPMLRPEIQFSNARMILVSPSPKESWREVLDIQSDDEYGRDEEMMTEAETAYFSPRAKECEIGLYVDCPQNETCQPLMTSASRTRSGMCQCELGFYRNASGNCIAKQNFVGKLDIPQMQATESDQTSNKPTKTLVVSVRSKEVQLPEDEVSLSAYTVPAEQAGEHYVFNWKLISQPDGGNSGTMNDQNSNTLKLGHLIEGVYTFKVTVSAPGAYGETTANITVLPPKRINQPPVAMITPASQTVKLPNTGAVLDGSPSHDDDMIIRWSWDLQSGPLGYQPNLEDTSTLQLNDLKIPGNYTFKLTVEDSDHATNWTTANITVVKVTDYPPEANAGQDVIIYLPNNNVTLNGNLSRDDRGIAAWEWTKSPSDQNKAVDMQKTRTPYLELSNLEEGMYTFVLKVTDDSGQTSSSDVHVFVKPPTNKPPSANAGQDVVVSLPLTWVKLDASESTDDLKIVSYHWKELKGPNKAVIVPTNASVVNATELTKGEYEFEVTVIDSNGNMATDSMVVTVTQNENAPPKANAGGDQTVILPASIVTLNGSSSSDDLAIKKWKWTREGSSLALGRVVGDSDTTSSLILTDLVPGRYVFRLKVTDGQGASDEDTVSIIVKPDQHLLHLVELTLNIEGGSLTVAQEQSLEAKLALLLRDASIHLRELRQEHNTGRVIVVFYVGQQQDKVILPGPEVVKLLKEKLHQDSGLLELSVANIQTAVCQNNCSGHGVCNQANRQCLCEAFWMQNLIRKHFGDGDSDCDWSILYVVIVLFLTILLVAGATWGIACLIHRACMRRPRKRQRYSLIDDEEEATMRALNKSVMVSESDSDSDVLFNRRDKANGDARNGSRSHRNGFVKLGRKIKT